MDIRGLVLILIGMGTLIVDLSFFSGQLSIWDQLVCGAAIGIGNHWIQHPE